MQANGSGVECQRKPGGAPSDVAVIADSHIGGPGGSAEPLAAQLRSLLEGEARHLVLLGDLFQVWVGDPRYETADIRLVVSVLEQLREAGFRIEYIEGNRDFFIAESSYARLFDHVGRETTFMAGGRRYLAVHGDGLDDRDRPYRFWRWLSKSGPSRFFVRHLPLAIAKFVMYRTEKSLDKTNFKHKAVIPKDVILRYAASRLGEGYDVLLLGHFHHPRRWDFDGGQVRLLEAWFATRSIEWFGEGS